MELDLEATCLALLAAEQPRLIDDIHALARAYHWTEAEVLAVPPRRRRQYLDRIERGRVMTGYFRRLADRTGVWAAPRAGTRPAACRHWRWSRR